MNSVGTLGDWFPLPLAPPASFTATGNDTSVTSGYRKLSIERALVYSTFCFMPTRYLYNFAMENTAYHYCIALCYWRRATINCFSFDKQLDFTLLHRTLQYYYMLHTIYTNLDGFWNALENEKHLLIIRRCFRSHLYSRLLVLYSYDNFIENSCYSKWLT